MARISGVDLPNNKRVEIALTYIFGVGLTTSKAILDRTGIDAATRVKDLTEDEIVKIRDALTSYTIEGDLRRELSMNIKRLMDVGCYRGQRHKRNLPCRGQRTKTNARTRRVGPKRTVAGKKKATK